MPQPLLGGELVFARGGCSLGPVFIAALRVLNYKH